MCHGKGALLNTVTNGRDEHYYTKVAWMANVHAPIVMVKFNIIPLQWTIYACGDKSP